MNPYILGNEINPAQSLRLELTFSRVLPIVLRAKSVQCPFPVGRPIGQADISAIAAHTGLIKFIQIFKDP